MLTLQGEHFHKLPDKVQIVHEYNHRRIENEMKMRKVSDKVNNYFNSEHDK
jgi:hypothetical protein